MQQLYCNQMITNLESVPYIVTCLRNLKGLMQFPLLVCQTSTDMFGMKKVMNYYEVCKFLVQRIRIA